MKTLDLNEEEFYLVSQLREKRKTIDGEFLNWWGANSYKVRQEYEKIQYCHMENLRVVSLMVWCASQKHYETSE